MISLVACAWCRKRVRDPAPGSPWRDGSDPGGEDVSHGMCDRCRPNVYAKAGLRLGEGEPLTIRADEIGAGSTATHGASTTTKRERRNG